MSSTALPVVLRSNLMPSPRLLRIVSAITHPNAEPYRVAVLVESVVGESLEELELACAYVLARRENIAGAGVSNRFFVARFEEKEAISHRVPDFVDEAHRFWFV
jgi:hypothetical protein